MYIQSRRMMYSRSFQHLAVAIFLLLCTSLLYLYQSAESHNIRHLASSVTSYVSTPSDVSDSHSGSSSSSSSSNTKAVDINAGYSVKPIAYIFPQFYPFPENNRIWGENFTEWTNVRRLTHNGFGLETIRPHDSFGMYNGLEYTTRKRWGDFLKASGFHGAVFHHYWFSGKPVMDHIVQAMLKDGEPDVPFMLSWANEPWTSRWDGGSGETYIAQNYGLYEGWRQHFDWLLPFFRSPKYIRSNGKVQFLVYNPTHIGSVAPHMFAAWRQWAIEEGLGGLDVVETYWKEKDGPSRWEGAVPDAMNEFQPHAGGWEHTKFSAKKKLSRVYHRGTMVCWDVSPRHLNTSTWIANPACHPESWKNHLVEMFRKIKSDPNPIGQENFFFVNALNEWGEGNALEPSNQFGDGYGKAFKAALEISEKEHQWPVTAENRRIKELQISHSLDQTPDVCVLVEVSSENAEDQKFRLSAMLRSLQAQKNQNWRALIIDEGSLEGVGRYVTDALDTRMHLLGRGEIPASNGNTGVKLLDLVIQGLGSISLSCSSAKFLLITDGGTVYEKNAFDVAGTAEGDMIGLNFESRKSLYDHPDLQNRTWDERCTRLEDPKINLCNPATTTNFDLAATFVNALKFQAEQLKFDSYTEHHPGHQAEAMAQVLTTERGWKFTQAPSKDCHVYANPAYTNCLRNGNFWFDSPVLEEMGCYWSDEFKNKYEKTWDLPALREFDLQFLRKNGKCVRYKEEAYVNRTVVKQPEPTPATGEKAAASSAVPAAVEGEAGKTELVKEKAARLPDDGLDR